MYWTHQVTSCFIMNQNTQIIQRILPFFVPHLPCVYSPPVGPVPHFEKHSTSPLLKPQLLQVFDYFIETLPYRLIWQEIDFSPSSKVIVCTMKQRRVYVRLMFPSEHIHSAQQAMSRCARFACVSYGNTSTLDRTESSHDLINSTTFL